mmetsp:Transcript_10352/g.9979  ORF Transcript_10352/g.9979 Transcript_10352/m.9979 type:complete len:90 (-) Transcript_10352:52-321(-)
MDRGPPKKPTEYRPFSFPSPWPRYTPRCMGTGPDRPVRPNGVTSLGTFARLKMVPIGGGGVAPRSLVSVGGGAIVGFHPLLLLGECSCA